MRLSRRFAPVFAAVAFMMVLPYDAVPHTRVVHGICRPPAFRRQCRTTVQGSHVCVLPQPLPGDRPGRPAHRVRPLVGHRHRPHRVDAGPAMTVRLTGRCWEEVRSAWVSHQR